MKSSAGVHNVAVNFPDLPRGRTKGWRAAASACVMYSVSRRGNNGGPEEVRAAIGKALAPPVDRGAPPRPPPPPIVRT